jgi:DNA-binding transcriptional LysR family regulator
MNYTLHQLRIFLSVVEHQSVSKAADALFLTQPAVSIQLKKLQEQFEIPLTERIGRQLYITRFGEEIAEVCRQMLAADKRIDETINRHQGLLSGDIHVATVSTGKYVMPYLLSGFVAQYPQVRVRMDVTNKYRVVEALAENQTDFALVSVLPDNMQLETIPLMSNHLFLVGNAKETAKLDKAFLEPNALSQLPLIFREPGSATLVAMEQFILEHRISAQKMLSLTSNEAVKQAVNAGLGFSIMPLIGLRNDLLAGELQLIPVRGLPIQTTWMLVYRKGKGLSPAQQAFLDYLETHKAELITEHFSWIQSFVQE